MILRVPRRGLARAAYLTCLAVAFVATPAMAQTEQVTAPVESSPEAAEAVINPVPAAEIATVAAETVTRTRDLVRTTDADESLEHIATALPEKIVEIEEFRAAPVNLEMIAASPKLLNEALQQWIKHADTLNDWGRTLDLRSEDVQAVLDELNHLTETWRVTAEDSSFVRLPAAVKQQVGSVRQELGAAQGEVGARRDRVLTLQNQISEQRIAVAADIDRLRRELSTRQDDIFHATMPPIWDPIRDDTGSLALGRDAADTWLRVTTGLGELRRDYRRIIRIQLVIFALVALGMWLLGRRDLADEEAESELTVAGAILRRPVAASGLLTILVMSPFYTDAPVVTHSLLPIAALPFAAWLAGAFVPEPRRRLVYGVLLLSLLVNLQNLMLTVGALRHLALIAIPVLGLGGTAAFQRRVNREDPVVWPGISRTALVLGWSAFACILTAGALGYLPLGELLANAAVELAYLAFLFLAGFRVIDALVLLALQTNLLRRLQVVQHFNASIRDEITRFVRFVAVALWLWVLMGRLLVRDAAVVLIRGWLTDAWEIGSLRISLGDIFLFFLVLWVTLLIAKIVRHLLQDDILPRAAMGAGRSHAVSMLVNYGVVGVGFFAALAAAGIAIEQFAIIGGALGVGIGFGLQNIVSNFVSGLILVFERPVQVGDTVEVGPLVGTVRRIGVRSSTVRTFDEAEVIVPNSDLISSHVVNWTKSDRLRRMEVKVGVQYGTDPVTVQEILVATAREHPKVLEYPSPYSLFKGFGDSSLGFVVRFWTSDFGNWIFIASEVTVAIDAALREAGITIPLPQRDLHIYSVDPPAPIPNGGGW